MRMDKLEVQAALEQGLTLPFAWTRTLSAVTLGPTPGTVDTAELLEARFFSSQEEIRVFQTGGGLEAVRLTAEAGDHMIEENRDLLSPRFGASVSVCHTLAFDEDGQARIAGSRLTNWKGGV